MGYIHDLLNEIQWSMLHAIDGDGDFYILDFFSLSQRNITNICVTKNI